ncbi:hypothetical protein BRADI_3g34961v3 [Brachypodium distachyon]|uniref:Protein kinase domain-containing protein n=1 Tax=Brachypodium distachyon TaxID=15368 RepID=A0A0Q3Q907_BRADI|nr:hypothetical protein BRADI_3g34961v3 [Brachypodium distachyon]
MEDANIEDALLLASDIEDGDSALLQAEMEDPITVSLGPMDRLLRRLHSFNAAEYNLPVGFTEDKIQNLKEDLQRLCVSLKDLSEEQEPSLTAKCGMKEARELCYDAEDLLDDATLCDIGASARSRRSSSRRLSIISWTPRKLKRRPQISTDLSELMARVVDANDRSASFLLEHKTVKPAFGQTGASQLPPLIQLPLEVLEEPTDKLVELLAFEEKQLKVVPIFGISGVGKTTVARTIYYRHGERFHCRAFVRVSRNPDMRRFFTSIISQIKAPHAHAFSDAHDLIDTIFKHLQGKRYLIIIDDLWTISVWDIISCAFPYADSCSRVVTTTQIEDVALSCCGYQSEYIFEMAPLNYREQRKLLFTTVFGSEGEYGCPEDFKEVSDGIVMKCGGSLLSTVNIASMLPRQPGLKMERWDNILRSLPSILKTNPIPDGMKEILYLIYIDLPPDLKTYLLYVSMYPEGYTIKKDELVKQWIAEGFLSGMEGVARGYFDELVNRGMLQPVHTSYTGEVLSCTVNHMVLDLIRYKSLEANFVITVDYLQSTLGLPDKVRRLSIQFGDAKSAKVPESIRMSHIRSLFFGGFFKCVPSIVEYRFLRVLVLHIWSDQDKTSYDLARIGELFRLRYLNIECNITIDLPDKIQGLKYLETLQIDARVCTVPSAIVHLQSLLHLCLPSDANLPHRIGQLRSLRTLGYFDLSSNATNSVMDLGKLTNLQDLHLTCSSSEFGNLKNNIKCLGLIVGKLSSLRCLTLVPTSSSYLNSLDDTGTSSTSSIGISFDGFIITSPPPALLQRLELLPPICIFSSIPGWIGELSKLCILKIEVMVLSSNDIDILKALATLTSLSLYVRTDPKRRIIFDSVGFSVLKYFNFMCTAPCMTFLEGSMPNVRKLKLRFNANKLERYDPMHAGFEYLSGLKEIFVKIGSVSGDESDKNDAERALLATISKHPSTPILNMQSVNWIFYGDKGGFTTAQEENNQTQEIQDVWLYASIDAEAGDSSPFQKKKEIQDVITEEYSDQQSEDPNKEPDSRTYMQSVRDFSSLVLRKTIFSWSIPRKPMEWSTIPGAPIEFKYKELRIGTNNFDEKMKLGQGGYGVVYRATIPGEHGQSMEVAVKRFSRANTKGQEDFLAEISIISRLRHRNLVKLMIIWNRTSRPA